MKAFLEIVKINVADVITTSNGESTPSWCFIECGNEMPE